MRSLMTAATGMRAQQLNLDVIANNIANVNTHGFKRSEVSFEDLLYVQLRSAGTTDSGAAEVPSGLEIGSGISAGSTFRVHVQGGLEQTDRPTDMAIEGVGFFEVTIAASGDPAYTRAGSFHVNSSGSLVTSDGNVLSVGITIPNDMLTIAIAADGTVNATTPSGIQNLGQIQLFRFQNPSGLESRGSNLYAVTAASGTAEAGTPGQTGFGTIRQGFLERSNVDIVGELIKMISAQRAYEVNSRAIRAGDEMMQMAARLGR